MGLHSFGVRSPYEAKCETVGSGKDKTSYLGYIHTGKRFNLIQSGAYYHIHTHARTDACTQTHTHTRAHTHTHTNTQVELLFLPHF